MNPEVRSELAPSGTLRAGINLANFLLVTGRSPEGDPQGVAPDMAAEIAKRLGVGIAWVPFATPSELADAAADDAWDVGLIGAEPARAETILFTAAYTEIEATYLVPDSPLHGVEDVDREGVRIAVARGSAYDLFLSRRLEHAELVRASGLDGSFDLFVEQELGMRWRGSGRASSPTWSGCPARAFSTGGSRPCSRRWGRRARASAGAAFLREFVEEAKANGLVQRLIDRHGVRGLSVAGAA